MATNMSFVRPDWRTTPGFRRESYATSGATSCAAQGPRRTIRVAPQSRRHWVKSQHGHSTHDRSHFRLRFSYHCGPAAKRPEWGHCRGFRRHGQPNSFWSAWLRHGAVSRDHLVRDYFHGDLDHAFGLRAAPVGFKFGAPGYQEFTGKIATGCAGEIALSRSAAVSS